MVGSWSGDWSPTTGDTIPVLFVMEWKSRAIVGVMNPGLDDEAPARGVLDSSTWTVPPSILRVTVSPVFVSTISPPVVISPAPSIMAQSSPSVACDAAR
jgi:hypothetical protein